MKSPCLRECRRCNRGNGGERDRPRLVGMMTSACIQKEASGEDGAGGKSASPPPQLRLLHLYIISGTNSYAFIGKEVLSDLRRKKN